ncbi:DUF5085 family protein [Anaeromicropila herbilytica]|uniref:DUF5085 domain-containing protein n=1 Tax=Anaeromicropila herbilytica TaxID=2785025 RepID=A0A7R7ENY1_9FIRM|nr:DUF5085 family protein [Anaeromicropila herbilytica]BCN31967.1 hypothetical protein bsdtb5_32620 [Anaeromicropila herbilytica]
MKIKRGSLILHHVISVKEICESNEWMNASKELRNAIIRNGLYPTGPMIYQMRNIKESDKKEFTLFIPVNAPINMEENEKFFYLDTLSFEDGLTYRHSDMDEDFEDSYELLKMTAQSIGVELEETFYNIYLPVFGGSIVDIYAPIIKM